MPATPPTTPPTIAPTGVERCVTLIGTVGLGVLREVATPELDAPALGEMRKKSMMYGLVLLVTVTFMSILWVPSANTGVWK